MWHLVCGDAAVEGVSFVLGAECARSSLRVLRDDLAVGPLHDIDLPPCCARAEFWRTVWPAEMPPLPKLEESLSEDARWLADLARQSRAVTVWQGDSAAEQLLLARVAAMLLDSDTELWEVACGTGDSSGGRRRAVAMHEPQALATLYLPRRVAPERQRTLAGQWRQAVQENARIRRWHGSAFHGEDFTRIDKQLLAAISPQWHPLGQAMADVMKNCDGFFATDMLLFWRARVLVEQGLIEAQGNAGEGYAGWRARRVNKT
ncbi:hypothetical protein DNJ95_15455 [Stutzerimonas kirkiae]|uniref:DUF1835 domain-containing protein n=1 Tax=Stutzerimonas kirkiae TaxID=2211392 RepID=A0A4Q9RCP7_9GAMM|nr:DUF1835 domain-containing protein [Stutzerimonas kirkiae]TBU98675.1 hypothetical protein DNJ96_05400 [Stutzerimonas kirkiae]TBV00229.1 hypothetical protein DNJ95_15455 [Stutzerimonas kirkiae]TBV14217.1 hypothetical protein DNK01_09095 [Stutzerimonas kirkiae]